VYLRDRDREREKPSISSLALLALVVDLAHLKEASKDF